MVSKTKPRIKYTFYAAEQKHVRLGARSPCISFFFPRQGVGDYYGNLLSSVDVALLREYRSIIHALFWFVKSKFVFLHFVNIRPSLADFSYAGYIYR